MTQPSPTLLAPAALARTIHRARTAEGHVNRLVAAATAVLADLGLEPTLETSGFSDPNLGELAYCVALTEAEQT